MREKMVEGDTYRTAWSGAQGDRDVVEQLAEQLAPVSASAIVFFCSESHDGAYISGRLRERFGAEVIGCTTAGEFTEQRSGQGGVVAFAFPKHKVSRVAAALADFANGVDGAVRSAMSALGRAFATDLRELDPARHVGIVLVDGLHMQEEAANEAIGNAAPLIHFVGGSAGDNLKFEKTRVFCNGVESAAGAVLLLIELQQPYVLLKTCSFRPLEHRLLITRADPMTRTVYEFNGRPAAQEYAALLGIAADQLDSRVFMKHPVGLMVDGQPWIRSPQQVAPDGGIRFYCGIAEGMEVNLMESLDLIEDTRRAVASARVDIGVDRPAALVFNCILRRLELDERAEHSEFLSCFGGYTMAGFHTYGESWMGHINQTLTAIVFC